VPAPGLTYVTVSDILYRGDGSFDSGIIDFRITQQVHRAGTVVITPTTFSTTLVNGAFSLSLPASDDPLNSPASWFYQVQVRTKEWNQVFYMPVLIALAGTGAKLSQLLDNVAVPAAPGFNLANFLQLTGGTMTGALILNADPTVALGAATRQFVLAQAASGVADATTTTKGKIQLAGDLAGTAAAPTVPALTGKAATVHTHAEADVSGLTTDLSTLTSAVAGKANTSHSHVEGDTTNLITDLAAKIAAAIATTKGDLLAATASATITRLGVGSNTQVLTADSTQATGMKWAPASGGGGAATNVPEPGFYGLKAFTADPQLMQNVQSTPSGTIWYAAVPVQAGQVISELWVANAAVATYDSSSTNNGLALADFNGVILGQTPDTHTLWDTAVGWRGAAMASSFTYTVPATGYLYLLALMRGMTNGALAFPMGCTDSHAPFVSLGPTQTKARAGYASGSSFANFDPTVFGTKSGFMFLGGVK
jgi:hypothetical protein